MEQPMMERTVEHFSEHPVGGWAVAAVVLQALLLEKKLTLEQITERVLAFQDANEFSKTDIENIVLKFSFIKYANIVTADHTFDFNDLGVNTLGAFFKSELKKNPEKVVPFCRALELNYAELLTLYDNQVFPFSEAKI